MARRQKKADVSLTLFSFQDIMCCLVGVLVLISLLLAIDGLHAESSIATALKEPQVAAAAEEASQELNDQLQQQVEALRNELAARQAGTAVTEREVEVLEARARQLDEEQEQLLRRVAALDEQRAAIKAAADAAALERAKAQERLVQAELQSRRQRVRLRPGALAARTPFFIEVTAGGVRIGDLDPTGAPYLETRLPPNATVPQVLQALGARDPSARYAVFVVHADGIAQFEALRDAIFRRGYDAGWQLWDGASGAFLEPPLGTPPAKDAA